MIYPGIHLTHEQEALIWSALAGLSQPTAWAVLKATGDLLRGKRDIADTDVRHALCAALVKARAHLRASA